MTTRLMAVIAGAFLLCSTSAWSQNKPDCTPAGAPPKVEGQIVKVDAASSKLTIKDAGGAMHEFQASKEAIGGYKVGDTIKANLRTGPPCK